MRRVLGTRTRPMKSLPTTLLQGDASTSPEDLAVGAAEPTTPKNHPNYSQKVSHDIKQRVRLATSSLNGSRCLITNGGHSVEYCHCVPRRALKEEDVVCLSSCTY